MALSLLLLALGLPGFFDYGARVLLLNRRYAMMYWLITPAVLAGELYNLIPQNPFAAGLPHALTLQALALLRMERSAEAEKSLRRLVAFHKTRDDIDPINRVRAMLLLGNALSQQGKVEESETIATEALAILESQPASSPRTLVTALCDLCATLSKEGKANQAITVGNRALTLAEALQPPDDSNLKMLGMVANNLAVAYNYAGQLERAKKLYERSLNIKLKLFGSESREAALAYNNVGYVTLLEGDYGQACQLLEKAKDLAVSLGLDSSVVWMDILANCGDVHRALGRFEESEKEQLEALRLRELKKNDGIHESFYCLGKLYRDTQDYAKAKTNFDKALKMREKRFGEHPKLARLLEDYAKLKRQMKLDSEADQMEARAQTIFKNFINL
jgi:tetratricopeptide (TPR) repeat protein